jgi:hypothetical protein
MSKIFFSFLAIIAIVKMNLLCVDYVFIHTPRRMAKITPSYGFKNTKKNLFCKIIDI